MSSFILRSSCYLRSGLLFLGLTLFVQAAPPEWWTAGNPPVITGGPVANYSIANIGQAKYMARQALGAIRAKDPYIADDIEEALVGPGRPIASWAAPSSAEESARQYAPLLVGQLKAISAPFYQKLNQKMPAWVEGQLSLNHTKDPADSSNYFPWTSSTVDDNNRAPATVGQLKAVFSLRFESIGVHVFVDTDADGMDDIWEQSMIALSDNSISITDFMPNGDLDGDGVTNLQEYQLGLNAVIADTDGDGYSDRLSFQQQLFLKLDESTGVNVADGSGNSRTGLLVGNPTWLVNNGVSAGALLFHGGSDRVAIPTTNFAPLGSFTVSLWFKTVSVANQTLLSTANAAQAPSLAISIESGNTVRLNIGNASVTWAYPRSLSDGLWHHLIVNRDVAVGKTQLQLDNATVGSALNVSTSPVNLSTLSLAQHHLTASTYDLNRSFVGTLDEVRIWSDKIDTAYLAELFHPNDQDNDGIPDDYEIAKADDLNKLRGNNNDFDGDGKTDRQEFEQGTSPTDYYNGVTPVITLISGGGQTIYAGQTTPLPLTFFVSNGGQPYVGAPVELRHLELIGGLRLSSGVSTTSSMTLKTDAQGKVSVYFKAN